MTSEFISVFITAASREEAEKIARAIVQENLAACANIFPGIHSINRWQGKVEEGGECAIIVKTKTENFPVLQRRVKELHSYECPCIVAWPIAAGDSDYLKWLASCF